jgi:hypothetical protein
MSAVMEVMVCSVSIARVRTLSILENRRASSDFAASIRARLESFVWACVAISVEMVVESSFWWVVSAAAVESTALRVDGWENIRFRWSIGS